MSEGFTRNTRPPDIRWGGDGQLIEDWAEAFRRRTGAIVILKFNSEGDVKDIYLRFPRVSLGASVKEDARVLEALEDITY